MFVAEPCARKSMRVCFGFLQGSVSMVTFRGQQSDLFKLIFGSGAELLISDDAPSWVCGRVWFQLNGHFTL